MDSPHPSRPSRRRGTPPVPPGSPDSPDSPGPAPAARPVPVRVVRDPEEAVCLLHPLRRRLLARLREPASASALARDLAIPRQKINYHLRELEKRRLVVLVEERTRGNCTERIVVAAARGFVLGPEVLGDLAADGPGIVVAPAADTADTADTTDPGAPPAGSPTGLVATLRADVRLPDAATRSDVLLSLGAEVERLRAQSAPDGVPHRILVSIHPGPVAADPAADPAAKVSRPEGSALA